MPVLCLGYRHCPRLRPAYLKHSEVEGLAVLARQQLVNADTDAISLSILKGISGLKINSTAFDLLVGTDAVVHDEDGNPVLGICEFDPGVPNAAMLSVSPVSENASEEPVLSTFGHELGHAIFDAPGWIVDATKGPGRFDDPSETTRKAYRTTTHERDHLSKAVPSSDAVDGSSRLPGNEIERDVYFAEVRANEFMESFPRLLLRVRLCV